MDDIHSRIKALRIARTMSMQALAEAVGVSWQTVQQWEKPDGTAPKRTRLAKVAKALRTTVTFLNEGATGIYGAPTANEVPPPPYVPANDVIAQIVALCESMTDIGLGAMLEAARRIADEHPKKPVKHLRNTG